MYLKHYNLDLLPFRNTPDPRFFMQTEKHNEALANLVFAVEQRRGFVMLTGEIGSGKTLVTHLLLQQIEDHALVALIRNTHLNSTQLIRLICDEFAVKVADHDDKASMLLSLNQFLIQQLAEDRLVVVVVDEAQNLSDRVLEELRMLSNLETSTEKLLQLVIVGQPELRDKVSQPQLEQLRTRISLSYHLEPLTPEEVRAYVDHRLKVAGPNHTVSFTAEAMEKIARFSRGTPRVINGLCDNALLYGFTANTTTIDEALIEKVLKQSMHMAPRQRVGPTRTPTYVAGTRPRPNPKDAAAATPPAAPSTAAEEHSGVPESPATPTPAASTAPPDAPSVNEKPILRLTGSEPADKSDAPSEHGLDNRPAAPAREASGEKKNAVVVPPLIFRQR